jgi:hypothetical protein
MYGRLAMPSVRPDEIWPSRTPGRPHRGILHSVLLIALFACGCGGATVPCPTPLDGLDRHRAEAEEAWTAAEEAEAAARSAQAERTEAERRLLAARASLDSLESKRGEVRGETPKP